MSDVFEEVEEGLRAEKVATLWSRLWPVGLGAALAIIAVVGGKSWMDHQRVEKIEKAGKAFEIGMKSLDIEDLDKARESFGEAIETDAGFAQVSAQFLADAELRLAGDTAAAAQVLNEASEKSGPLSDMALLKAAYLKVDSLDLAQTEEMLEPLLVRTGGFNALAQELVAAKAMAEGDLIRARTEYQVLAYRLDAPEGVQQRAQEALSILPPLKVVDEKGAAASDADAGLDEEAVPAGDEQ